MKKSCHTYEWVMAHIWMSHATHTNESCHTYEWVMSHIRMSHVIHTNESWRTYEWVMSHIWMSHVTRMNAWLVHVCDATRSHIHTATHCNTLQHTATHCNTYIHTPHLHEDMCECMCERRQNACVSCECMCGVWMYVWRVNVCVSEWLQNVWVTQHIELCMCYCAWMYVCVWEREACRHQIEFVILHIRPCAETAWQLRHT